MSWQTHAFNIQEPLFFQKTKAPQGMSWHTHAFKGPKGPGPQGGPSPSAGPRARPKKGAQAHPRIVQGLRIARMRPSRGVSMTRHTNGPPPIFWKKTNLRKNIEKPKKTAKSMDFRIFFHMWTPKLLSAWLGFMYFCLYVVRLVGWCLSFAGPCGSIWPGDLVVGRPYIRPSYADRSFGVQHMKKNTENPWTLPIFGIFWIFWFFPYMGPGRETRLPQGSQGV